MRLPRNDEFGAAGPAAIEVIGLSKRVADASGELTILHRSILPCNRPRRLPWSAPPVPASRRCSACWPASTRHRGKVLLDGTDIFALDEDGRAAFRKARLGFVFQSFQLLAHLNALENVMLPLELRGDGDARAKAEAMLGRVGLGSRLKPLSPNTCRAASSSAWRWRAPSSPNRRCCSPTSRPAAWMPPPARRSSS
jgi:putative ABC transport system ATP-binding protein